VGYAHGDVVLTNISSSPCSLSGLPTISLLSGNSAPLNLVQRPATDPPRPSVTLQPNGTAGLIVSWANWCGSPPGPLDIQIGLDAGMGIVTGPFNGPPDYDLVPPCIDQSQPSTVAVVDGYLFP
jgi:hypothetical protein